MKTLFLKISKYSQEINCVGVRPATLLKRDSNTGVEEHLRTVASRMNAFL